MQSPPRARRCQRCRRRLRYFPMASGDASKAAMLAAAAARQPAGAPTPVPHVRSLAAWVGVDQLWRYYCMLLQRPRALRQQVGPPPLAAAACRLPLPASTSCLSCWPAPQDVRQQEQKFAEARKAMIKVVNWQARSRAGVGGRRMRRTAWHARHAAWHASAARGQLGWAVMRRSGAPWRRRATANH